MNILLRLLLLQILFLRVTNHTQYNFGYGNQATMEYGRRRIMSIDWG